MWEFWPFYRLSFVGSRKKKLAGERCFWTGPEKWKHLESRQKRRSQERRLSGNREVGGKN